MKAACFSRGFADLAYDIHARDYFAEDGVAVALRGFVFEVEECIVGSVDEELAGGGIRIAGTRHGDGAEDGEKEEDNQPGKRGADVFLFVQHAQDAAERGAGVGENEDFCPGDVF